MSSAFFGAVRVHPEPFEYLDERTVHDALVADPERYLDHLDRSLAGIAAGEIVAEQPSKVIFTDPGLQGDFRVMPCVVRRGSAVCKTVKIVGTNVRQETVRDQITVGKAFRLDPLENFVTHIIEACLLSSARTGACAAIALRHLAASRRHVAIVGAGRVGCYAAFYAAALGDVAGISFLDAAPERAQAAATLAAALVPNRIEVTAGAVPAFIEADAVVLATTSAAPVLSPASTSAPVVISTGADTVHQHELTSDWPACADVYIDTPDGFAVGDLARWLSEGLFDRQAACDLMALYRRGPRPGPARRVFVSTGSALFDNLTIGYILGDAPAGAA